MFITELQFYATSTQINIYFRNRRILKKAFAIRKSKIAVFTYIYMKNRDTVFTFIYMKKLFNIQVLKINLHIMEFVENLKATTAYIRILFLISIQHDKSENSLTLQVT